MESSVSVIIPTYNRAGLIVRSVESALAAMSPGDEILVIDDGSTDDTAEVLRPFYERIRYLRIEKSGPGRARNKGVSLAKGPLISLLDSDDEWFPDKLYLQRRVMDKYPDLVFSFTDLLSRLPDGKVVHHVLNVWRNNQWVGFHDIKRSLDEILGRGILFSSIAPLPEKRDDFTVHIGGLFPLLMEAYYVWTSSIMVRKEPVKTSFRFAEDQNICEDWECFARLAREGQVAYLNCETAVQNVHREPRLTDAGDVQQATARIKMLHRVWGEDEAFLKGHGLRYQAVLNSQYLRRAKYWIKMGRIDEAKKDLISAGGGPLFFRFLTSLPFSLVQFVIRMRRKILEMRRHLHLRHIL